MAIYGAYGVRVDVDAEFPELARNRGATGIASNCLRARTCPVRRLQFNAGRVYLRTDDSDGNEWLECATADDGYILRFIGMADFYVSRTGDLIECTAIGETTSEQVLRHLLLDAVIPRVLDLRGVDAIHATAVSIDGAACAFLGPTGAGKSTLATSLARSGAPLLGDDCVVLSGSNPIMLTPGYAGARLWDDSFDALGLDSSARPGAADGNWKRRVPEIGAGFSSEPQPLKRIFRLARAESATSDGFSAPAIEELSPAQAFIELASASYRFNPTDRARNLQKFGFFEKVVTAVPIRKLIIPNDFDALPAVRELILADLHGESPVAPSADRA